MELGCPKEPPTLGHLRVVLYLIFTASCFQAVEFVGRLNCLWRASGVFLVLDRALLFIIIKKKKKNSCIVVFCLLQLVLTMKMVFAGVPSCEGT